MVRGLIQIGSTVINLDIVLQIELNWVPEGEEDEDPQVVFEFALRGMDEPDGGQNFTSPYLIFFKGEEAEAVRRHLTQDLPDLLENGGRRSRPPARA
jgi:hypothetical protein